MSLKQNLEKGFKKFTHVVEDIATIDVVTLTGELTLDPDQDKGAEPADGAPEGSEQKALSLTKVYKRLETAALTEDSTISVVAFTHIEIDADSVNFVKTGLTPEQVPLLTAHNEAVKAAEETRQGIIRTVQSFFS